MNMHLTDIIGLMGVCCFLYAYFLLQTMRVQPSSPLYLWLNLAGAIMVMISLIFKWNFAAFLLEAVWASITIYGLYKHVYLARRKSE